LGNSRYSCSGRELLRDFIYTNAVFVAWWWGGEFWNECCASSHHHTKNQEESEKKNGTVLLLFCCCDVCFIFDSLLGVVRKEKGIKKGIIKVEGLGTTVLYESCKVAVFGTVLLRTIRLVDSVTNHLSAQFQTRFA
jgi:hypothetical protein